jgi:hypothetical protein
VRVWPSVLPKIDFIKRGYAKFYQFEATFKIYSGNIFMVQFFFSVGKWKKIFKNLIKKQVFELSGK